MTHSRQACHTRGATGEIMGALLRFAVELQSLTFFSWRVVCSSFGRPFYLTETLEQLYVGGVGSLWLVILTGLMAGEAIAINFSTELADFGAKTYLGRIMVLAIVRELGPTLTGIMVAARVASGITAEIGSMKSSNQIDALKAFSIDPMRKLAAPRLIALLIMVPALTVVCDIIGLLGGYVIAVFHANISGALYWAPVVERLNFGNISMGLIKPVIFAMIIAFVSLYMGFTSKGGAKGVGHATNQSVVITSISILLANFVITQAIFKFIRGYF
ncbi:MAG: MlaE family ABC transporter permease [Candidatus Zixiibacteriota bacterium]